MKYLVPVLSLALAQPSSANIFADFTFVLGSDGERTFTAELFPGEAPLTVANFMLLAGLEADKWNGPAVLPINLNINAPRFAAPNRPTLEIVPILSQPGEEDDPNDFHVQIARGTSIFGGSVIGTVFRSVAPGSSDPVFKDRTTDPIIEIKKEQPSPQLPARFVLTINHLHTWLDNRSLLAQPTQTLPMYSGLPVTNIEPGARFFTGSFTSFSGEGPGYTIQDELIFSGSNTANPWRNWFSQAFILGMDNAGPNTAGSRFFVTQAPNPDWNARYTAFGRVTTNRPVVQQIMSSPIEPGEQAPRGVALRKIEFRRTGLLAVPFFPHLFKARIPDAPVPTPSQLAISGSGRDLTFTSLIPGRSVAAFVSTPDLPLFRGNFFLGKANPINAFQLVESDFPNTAQRPKEFFYPYQVTYPTWPAEDDLSLANKTFNLVLRSEPGNLILTFGEQMIGSSVINGTYDLQTNGSRLRGSFVAQNDNTDGPYLKTLRFISFVAQDGQEPPELDRIHIHMDSLIINVTPLLRRFEAFKLPEDRFSTFSGVFLEPQN